MIDDRVDRGGWCGDLVPGESAHPAPGLRSTCIEERTDVIGVVDAEARTDHLDFVAELLVKHARRDCVGLEELLACPDPEGFGVRLIPDVERHVLTAELASGAANELCPLAQVFVRRAATFRPCRADSPTHRSGAEHNERRSCWRGHTA